MGLEASRAATNVSLLVGADGTCAFPDNLIGCENMAEMGVRPLCQQLLGHVWQATATHSRGGKCSSQRVWVGLCVQGVKWLSDDLELECEGVEEGEICPAKAKGSFPSVFGV